MNRTRTPRFARALSLSVLGILLSPARAWACDSPVPLSTFLTPGYVCTVGGRTLSGFTAFRMDGYSSASVLVSIVAPASGDDGFRIRFQPTEIVTGRFEPGSLRLALGGTLGLGFVTSPMTVLSTSTLLDVDGVARVVGDGFNASGPFGGDVARLDVGAFTSTRPSGPDLWRGRRSYCVPATVCEFFPPPEGEIARPNSSYFSVTLDYSFFLTRDLSSDTWAFEYRPGSTTVEVRGRDAAPPSVVPEPASVSMLGLGVLGLLGMRRRTAAVIR
jgi:hypothetical protein